jgi:GAF domain-containing protein
MYYPAPHVFSKDEVDLAVTIARQLGFSIEHFRAVEFRRRAQDRQELLAREIQHRTKNLFAVVLAVVSRSLVGTYTVGMHRPQWCVASVRSAKHTSC